MVSCLKCMKPLPYDCTCTTSLHEKLSNYLTQAQREIQLLESIINGHKPQIKITFIKHGGKIIDEEIHQAQTEKVDDFFYNINIEDIPIRKNTDTIVTLLDKDGNPLYRRKFNIGRGRTFTVTWRIGIGR